MKKICYIISNIDKAVAFEWIASRIDATQFEIHFILLNQHKGQIYEVLIELNKPTYFIELHGKKNYLTAGFKLIRILKKINPDCIHTHMRDADILGLFIARLAGIKNRITTRHSSTFNHIWYPKSVKWDKFINSQATKIVAISPIVEEVLLQHEDVQRQKIRVIPHGFDLDAFSDINPDRVKQIKSKYNIPENKIIIGVVARYIEWKGIEYIISAFKKILAERNDIILILANASGPQEAQVKKALSTINVEYYREIKFENDLFALFQCFNFYVHTPIDREVEAFGQTYVEALASGIPSVFTLSGIANEFIIDKRNAIVVPYKNSDAIKSSVLELINNPELGIELSKNGKADAKQFNLDTFILKLENLYKSI